MHVKIHSSSRDVVAICDFDLLGKRFEEGIRQLELRETFFKGTEMPLEETISMIKRQRAEDATFNIVGEESVKAALKAGLVSEDEIDKIQGIPFILILA